MVLRRSAQRGHADHGWLRSFHSFSFADYVDPNHMGFGALRVINEDFVAPGTGFDTHGHRDMEIVTYLLSGQLTHKDNASHSEGGGAARGVVMRAGDVQRMSAGRGIQHSEWNHGDETTHLLQIWIHPERKGLDPNYEQKHFSADDKRGRLCLLASKEADPGALTIGADASIYASLLDDEQAVGLELPPYRLVYVHLVRGELDANGYHLRDGDALMLSGESRLDLLHSQGAAEAEVLVFDLASMPMSSFA